jgi:hypothetical protein
MTVRPEYRPVNAAANAASFIGRSQVRHYPF